MTKTFFYSLIVLVVAVAISAGVIMVRQGNAEEVKVVTESNLNPNCPCLKSGTDCGCSKNGGQCGCGANKASCSCSGSCQANVAE